MFSRRIVALLGGGVALVFIAAACFGGSGDGERPSDAGASPTADNGQEMDTETDSLPGSLQGLADVWNTNWAKRSIDLGELTVGIGRSDPRDVIPPIDAPQFETVAEAEEWLADREPVLLLRQGGEARAYPIQILTWHEIVNDEVGGVPVAITFCPLCNTAIVFERTVDGQVLRLGTSGLLRLSDLVMWDDRTESLWQQITGEAIVGDLTGTTLEFLPSSIIPFSEFKAGFPDGQVLSRQTGFARSYGQNPYQSYSSSSRPFLFNDEVDDRFPALERVVAATVNGEQKAYPFSIIAEERAVNDELAGIPIAVFWGASDTADALDSSSIAEGQAVGAGLAYRRTVDGQVLTFEPLGDDTYKDSETGSVWDILGQAIEGPLAGEELEPLVHANHFWFAWAAFNADSPVYTGSSG